MRTEAAYSWLVDKSILPILSHNPHTGGVCSIPLHALTYLSAAIDIVTGIFQTRIFYSFCFCIWFGFHLSANMTIRTARPNRGQHYQPRMHCLKKVGGYHSHYYWFILFVLRLFHSYYFILNLIRSVDKFLTLQIYWLFKFFFHLIRLNSSGLHWYLLLFHSENMKSNNTFREIDKLFFPVTGEFYTWTVCPQKSRGWLKINSNSTVKPISFAAGCHPNILSSSAAYPGLIW